MTVATTARPAHPDPVERVTNLELFFDLVFVFTITQLTSTLTHDLTWAGAWRVAVLLALIYWMYGGYAWLTNNVPADNVRRRLLLVGGMGGYLVMALAVPTAFTGDGLAFGLAWLLVVVIHSFLFVQAPSDLSAAAMRGFAPYNLVPAIAVAVGGAIGGTVQDVVFPLAAVFVWSTRFLYRPTQFEIGPAHFVERHGLVVIVAIGESVVAIGIGAAGLPIDGALVAVAVLGLLLSTGLWWAYFGDEESELAEAAVTATPPSERAGVVLRAYGDAHLLLLLGIVLAAVGIETVVAHPGDRLRTAAALALAGGVSVFLVGDAYFRRVLELGRARWRLGTAAVVLLAVPVATEVNATAGLTAVTVVLAAALSLERLERLERWR